MSVTKDRAATSAYFIDSKRVVLKLRDSGGLSVVSGAYTCLNWSPVDFLVTPPPPSPSATRILGAGGTSFGEYMSDFRRKYVDGASFYQ